MTFFIPSVCVVKDFECALMNIDQYTRNRDKEQIRFVAGCIFPVLADSERHDPPSEICNQLQCEFDRTKALAIFRKILENSCLKIDHVYVEAMYSHCPAEVSNPGDLLDKLCLRKEILEKCSELEQNEKLFQKFLDSFKSVDIGMSTHDIKSHVILLQRLSVKPGMLEKVPSLLAEANGQVSLGMTFDVCTTLD